MFGTDFRRDTNMQKKDSYSNSKTYNIAGDHKKILEIIDQPDSEGLNIESNQCPNMSLILVSQQELDNIGATGITLNDTSDEESLIPESRPCNLEERQISADDPPTINEICGQEQQPMLQSTSPPSPVGDDFLEIILNDQRPTAPAKLATPHFRTSGRTLDPIWNDFHENPSIPKTQVECSICGAAVSRKVERLRSHVNKSCQGRANASVSRRKSVPEVNKRKSPPSTNSRDSEPRIKSSKIQKLDGFVDKISKTEQDKLNVEIGKYIYATNLPFSHVENQVFKNFMKIVRPASQLPSRWMIGNTILNKVYENATEAQEDTLKGRMVTIMQDGWKSRTSEPVIAHSVTTGEKSFLLNATGTGERKKTAVYCARLLKKNILRLQELGAEVSAVVTDNCKSMEKMRRLTEADYPGIYTYGCHPHLLNLVGKKFTPLALTEKVQAVNSFFRNHEIAWSLLKKQKCGRPILTCETRWNAWIRSLEYYQKNHAKLLEVSRNPIANVSGEVCEILNDTSVYLEVKTTIEYLKPVQVALDSLQEENASLADGVSTWIQLKKHLNIHDDILKNYFDLQFGKALQPVALGAYMVHPIYRGEALDSDLTAQGNAFLSQKKPVMAILASQLREKDDTCFPQHLFDSEVLKCSSPTVWWRSLKPLGKIEEATIDFFIKLLRLPAGSADIERHFSVLGNIMNVRRSRLGIKKSGKLCVIYKHLAGSCPPNDDGGDWDVSDNE